jgi:hypothetical protein
MFNQAIFDLWVTFATVSALRTRHLTLLNLRIREPSVTLVLGVQRVVCRQPSLLPRYFYMLGEAGNCAEFRKVFEFSLDRKHVFWLFSCKKLNFTFRITCNKTKFSESPSKFQFVFISVGCVYLSHALEVCLKCACTRCKSRILRKCWLLHYRQEWRFSCLLVTLGGWK